MIKSIPAAFALCCMLMTFNVNAGHHNEPKLPNLVETAASTGQFETLIAAAKAAGLVEALTGDGPLTVFAPTDDAFGTLPAGTIDSLLKPENREQLATILKYHVIAGRIGSDALADGVALDTLAGPSALVQATEKGFTIQGARIVATDIAASNGVVHVIDRVILPPARMSQVEALMMINEAISMGVPAFNHGQPEKTVEIYGTAAMRLLNEGPSLSMKTRDALSQSIMESQSTHDDNASAWKLRYALDNASRSLAMTR